jgi:IS30 family transposase
VNPETEARIIELKKQGCSLGQISAEVGLNRGTISRALRRLDMGPAAETTTMVSDPNRLQIEVGKRRLRQEWTKTKPQDKEVSTYLWKGYEVGKCPECERRMHKPAEGWPCLACRVKQRTGGAGEKD